MTTQFELTAVFEPVEEGWVQATIAELPGVITAGPTLDEAKMLLADALREYLQAAATGEERSQRADGAHATPLAVTLHL